MINHRIAQDKVIDSPFSRDEFAYFYDNFNDSLCTNGCVTANQQYISVDVAGYSDPGFIYELANLCC